MEEMKLIMESVRCFPKILCIEMMHDVDTLITTNNEIITLKITPYTIPTTFMFTECCCIKVTLGKN